MTATRVCALDHIEDGSSKRFDVEGHAIALVRIGNDVYAIGDTCSHQDISMAGGEVDPDECTLECPKHGSTFDLRTGEPQCLPAVRPVPTYDVRVDGDGVWVEIS